MQTNFVSTQTGFISTVFYVVSFLTLTLGLSLCLLKSPTEKSEYYLTMAEQFQNQIDGEVLQNEAEIYLLNQSLAMAQQAIKHTPYNSKAWYRLSLIYAQMDDMAQAMRARDVAGQLGLTPLPTLSAMRALLPPRNLALSEPLGSNIAMR